MARGLRMVHLVGWFQKSISYVIFKMRLKQFEYRLAGFEMQRIWKSIPGSTLRVCVTTVVPDEAGTISQWVL